MRNKAEQYVREHLIPYTLCNRCKSHVLKSDNSEYKYQCLYCDEDLYDFEVHQMEELKEINDFDFEDLINKVMESDLV